MIVSFLCLRRWVRSVRGLWRCSPQFLGPVVCCWWASPCQQTTGCWWRRGSSCSRTRPPRWRWRCTLASGGSALWQVGNNTHYVLKRFSCLAWSFSMLVVSSFCHANSMLVLVLQKHLYVYFIWIFHSLCRVNIWKSPYSQWSQYLTSHIIFHT